MFRRRVMEEQLERLADRVTWLEAKLLEEREANDELTKRLIDLHEEAEKVPQTPPPTANEILSALQQVLDATATASTKAAAAMDDRVDALVAERLTALRDELDARTVGTNLEAERRIVDLSKRTTSLAADVDGVRLRLGELSEALNRQFDELGHELDGLGVRSRQHDTQLAELAEVAASVPEGAVQADELDARAQELRNNQARIANELVRFEVALRQEVALLAEKVQAQSRNGDRR